MKILKNIIKILGWTLFVVGLFIATIGNSLLEWFSITFGVSFREIIYTIKAPMNGADTNFLRKAVEYSESAIATFCAIIIALIVLRLVLSRDVSAQVGNNTNGKRGLLILRTVAWIVMLCFLAVQACDVLIRADEKLKIKDFVVSSMSKTHLYEDYYVKPDIEKITSDKKRNLLYIYMESLETSYASTDVGGFQGENNYIPNLTRIASENISFSEDDRLGGFHCCVGASWTAGALFASESGIPFTFVVDLDKDWNADLANRSSFAKGAVCLGDILHEKGYYQEFLCGSDAVFGGRKSFFEGHGEFDIYDLTDATQNGYITEDEYVWWGLEDKNLYKIAKDELTRIAALDQPFNLTMLTVDTHHVGGWVCDLCGDEYPDQVANVVACADRQIDEFISWCTEQSWFENTTIVIQGDHPRMDNDLVEGISYYDRTVYNCFINSAVNTNGLNTNNRDFTPMDMFPTVLAAMGYEIPGNRLGLGTNLFSGATTLLKELGFENLETELCKYSAYYMKNFS